MAIRFMSLTDANTPAVRELVMSIWDQDPEAPSARALFAWRYRARPRGETQLAFDGDRCVGIVDSLVRPYLYEGRVIPVRETCDWFCLPAYRPLGLGAVLMRRLMARPEPILSIGGSKSTLALLPRLKWRRVGDVNEYVLPRTARVLTAWGLRGLGLRTASARWVPSRLPFRNLKAVRSPGPAARVELLADPNDASPPPPAGYVLAEILDEKDRAWLTSAPAGLRDLIALRFSIDSVPVGISLSRMEPYAGRRAGKILHLQTAACPPAVLEWILGETARHLVECGAEMLLCRASCPMIGHALRNLGFLCLQDATVYWWSHGSAPLNGPMHLTYLRADDALPFEDLAQPHRHRRTAQRSIQKSAGRFLSAAGPIIGAAMIGLNAL